jgi:DNA-directed RNA polymerase subunit RPC12/RpoP
MDAEDLFCANCGTENPTGGLDADSEASISQVTAVVQQASVYSFACEGCGASMSYDASAKSLRCPFCGSSSMTARKNARTLKPSGIIPFRVDRHEIEAVLKRWLAQGFWRPDDTATAAVLAEVTQVFVPFWVFSATTRTEWSADASPPPLGARASWYPVSGSQKNSYSGVMVPASGILSIREVEAIQPFDLSTSVDPQSLDLTNVVVEEFRLPKKEARPIAIAKFEQLEAAASSQFVRGSVRNMHVNVMLGDLRSEPYLLPMWIMVYHYKKVPYRVLLNGQTGEIHGAVPVSYTKISIAFAIIFLAILLVIFAVIAGSS